MKSHQFQAVGEAEWEARKALRGALLAGDEAVLLLLSGGSALGLLDGLEDITQKISPRLTISVLDERYSDDPNTNNFAQVTATEFFEQAMENGAQAIDTRVNALMGGISERKNLELFSDYFEAALRQWRGEHPEGKVIITQGIGADGHTAGVFPYPEDPEFFRKTFDVGGRWVVGYDATGKNPYPLRATVTLSFLREEVDTAIVFAVGKEKREALERVTAANGTLAETPARIVREMSEIDIFSGV